MDRALEVFTDYSRSIGYDSLDRVDCSCLVGAVTIICCMSHWFHGWG